MDQNQTQQPVSIAAKPTQAATITSKVFDNKGTLFVALQAIVYVLFMKFNALVYVWSILWLIAVIYGYMSFEKIRHLDESVVTEKHKAGIIAAMSFSPLIVQAFCYYGLKKTKPGIANILNTVGWKILGLILLSNTIAVVIAGQFTEF